MTNVPVVGQIVKQVNVFSRLGEIVYRFICFMERGEVSALQL